MNKQELIESISHLPSDCSGQRPMIDKLTALELIKLLDEQKEVTVPQSVAAWIEDCKTEGKSLLRSLLYTPEKVNSWVEDPDNQETFARAWLDGYTVEKEKRCLVKVKGVNDYGCYLNKGLLSKKYFWESKAEIGGCRTKHTRKQLEVDGFGWVFDCEGIEIEEVVE